jgi:hypothetical protein
VAIFQMILFFQTTQGTATQLYQRGTFNANHIAVQVKTRRIKPGRAPIGAKHAQRSRGGQGAWAVQFFAVWATIS